MQCPHHSNRLCPAYRSHPRPDHQPCPPPSPCESHPRHRAAPARARCDFHRSPAHRAPLHEISATREALSKLRTWNVCSPRQRERSPPSCQRVVLRCAVSARPLAKSGAPRGVAASRLATLARAASGYGYAFASLSPPREALPLQFARPARVAASRVCRHRATPAVSPAARLRRGKARVAREAYRARALSGAPSRSPASGGNMLRASLARWRGATEFNAARFIAPCELQVPTFCQQKTLLSDSCRFRKPQVKGSIPFSGSSVWEAVGAGGEGNQDRVECKADEERARRLRDSVIRQPSFFQPARLIPSAAANVSFSHCANGAHSAQVAHVCTRRRCVST